MSFDHSKTLGTFSVPLKSHYKSKSSFQKVFKSGPRFNTNVEQQKDH